MRAAAILGQFGFAVGHRRAENALLAFQDAVDGRADFVADRGVLGFQVKQRNVYGLQAFR